MLAAVEAGVAGRRIHAGRDQARRRRLRARREAPGAADGEAAARPRRAADRRTTPPTRWRSRSATCIARHADPARPVARPELARREGGGSGAMTGSSSRPGTVRLALSRRALAPGAWSPEPARDRVPARPPAREASEPRHRRRAAASATTCRCRSRRSTGSASRAATSRCACTRTCARTRSRSSGSHGARAAALRAADRDQRDRAEAGARGAVGDRAAAI